MTGSFADLVASGGVGAKSLEESSSASVRWWSSKSLVGLLGRVASEELELTWTEVVERVQEEPTLTEEAGELEDNEAVAVERELEEPTALAKVALDVVVVERELVEPTVAAELRMGGRKVVGREE